MNETERSLDEIFDIPTINKELTIIPTDVSVSNTEIMVRDAKEEDFQLTRENIKEVIGKGREALDGIMDLAKASEHPRVYEVVGQLISTLVSANKDLMNLHKQNKELNKREDGDPAKNVTNAIFVGSTAELQKIIKGKDVTPDE